jgi:hypothetical protein
VAEPGVQRPVTRADERQGRGGDAEQGRVLVAATGGEEAARCVHGRRGEHGAGGRGASRGGGQAERDKQPATGLTQPCRECAQPPGLEAHLLERRAGAFQPVSAQPSEEFLDPVCDEDPAHPDAQCEKPGVLPPSHAHGYPFPNDTTDPARRIHYPQQLALPGRSASRKNTGASCRR